VIRGGIFMSSSNAAPARGRTASGARVVDFARQQERRRIRRHLEETTQRTLEHIATAGDDLSAAELERLADAEATRLREYIQELGGDVDGTDVVPGSINDAVGRLHSEVHVPICCMLHDTTLQMLEYLSTDGYGAQLSAADVRRLAAQALADLGDRLDRLGERESCQLVTGLQAVIAEASCLGLDNVELVTGEMDDSITGDDAAALVAAVREALNNVRKHSRATRVLISCDVKDGEAHITVRDNGIGVDVCSLGGGMGVRQSIFKRMSTRGGHASLDSAPGKGVLVTLRMANGGRVYW
jgi:two-component sensor histidine kinase